MQGGEDETTGEDSPAPSPDATPESSDTETSDEVTENDPPADEPETTDAEDTAAEGTDNPVEASGTELTETNSTDADSSDADSTGAESTDTGSEAVADTPPAPPQPTGPILPASEAKPSATVMGATATATTGAETWYRTDQDRNRSVHRRANPWYRRLARGVIGLAFVAAAGIGLFFAAQLIQDYIDRDKLPDVGSEVPTIRATSFEIRSTAPAPTLDGTLTLDSETGAFEYTGRGTGPQSGIQVVSQDGSTVYIRRGLSAWETAGAADQVAADAQQAAAYLSNDDNADDILTTQLRRGYVDLIERVEIGEGDDEVRLYEMRFDTASFDENYPLQYQDFESEAIPGVETVRGLLVSIQLDSDDVLVAVDDTGTNWSWQRLTYSDQPFTPIDPANDLLTATIVITDGNVGN